MTEAGSAARIRRRRPPRDPEATMSLIAHLTELRNRIAKSLLALLLATAVAFWWYDHGLGEFIRAPYCNLPADLRYGGDENGCGLLITDVFGGVFIRLKVAFLAGAVLSAPLWLYQLWAFITPGLKRQEKLYGVGFVAVSSLLFAAGAVLAGADEAAVGALARYGRFVGVAFQITDDILGVFGDPATTGKSTTSDLREGKQTALTAHAATTDAWPSISGRLGDPELDDSGADLLREALLGCGALDAARRLADEYVTLARFELDTAELPEPLRTELGELAGRAAERAR